jgi:hypothetical protein
MTSKTFNPFIVALVCLRDAFNITGWITVCKRRYFTEISFEFITQIKLFKITKLMLHLIKQTYKPLTRQGLRGL